MDLLWTFAKDFLRMLPPDVQRGDQCICEKIDGKGTLEGLTVKKLWFPNIRAGMAALNDLMGRLDEEEQMREVLDAPEEDFRDETYCCHDLNLPPHVSYFS
jgi:hypothetical protein